MTRRPALAAAALAVAALAVAPAAPAVAATDDGYVRLAHMSPDTAAVNITLSSISGDVTLFRLQNVGYGAVSKYMRLPQGTYALAMVPAGSDSADATPVVSGSVEIKAGKAETVAAVGLNKDLKTKAITDDIGSVGSGDARVRIVQASTKHDSVNVASGSTTIADDAAFGDVSGYKTVKAGSLSLKLGSGSDAQTVDQTVEAGSANTLFVIDDKKGDLTVAAALDSAAATETPVGSLAAGGGGIAVDDAGVAGGLAGAAALGGLAVAAVLMRRRIVAQRG